ncbi:Papain inhibitor [Escovopsis weberi]|uniref:Papain inhibitor n=1 Tax=Escovopsis weberi TaxID=150374 RepID=A0A0M9VWC3_ESCWE|nr:Papain inhibitor [Escovopsis weberi]
MIFTTLAMAALALAAPSAQPASANTDIALTPSSALTTGSITYYQPGLGACGKWNSKDDLIVAVSAPLFDRSRPCGRRIRVSYNGRSADVTVVDRCEGCAENDLDLSPAAFKRAIGGLGLGRVNANWAWI